MERITFFDRYRISVATDGTPRELSRNGAAVTYKAVDLQSGEPVALKIIPMSAVDPAEREQFQERARAAQQVEHPNVARLLAFIVDADDFVLVSEYPQGDTIASWIAMHGPLDADATLRVGLQVVAALQAAAFHNLTHPAIEPSSIVIVPGQTADGAWPAIKLTNLDTAGLKLNASPETAAAAPIAPQFASPEQLQSGAVDFPSEMYSLGATMCFMLTGRAPLGVGMTSDGAVARLPAGLRKIPRRVRDLLLEMLRPIPGERPQDPVAFAERLRDCLASLQGRRIASRKVPVAAVPTAAVFPAERRRIRFPGRPLAIAAAVLALALIAGLVLAQPIRRMWLRHTDVTQIGVPVGVPDKSAPRVANAPTQPQPAQLPATTAAPAAQRSAPAPEPQQNASNTSVATNSSAAQQQSAPPAPAETTVAAADQPRNDAASAQQDDNAVNQNNEAANRIAAADHASDEPAAPEEEAARNTPTRNKNVGKESSDGTDRIAVAEEATQAPAAPAEGPAARTSKQNDSVADKTDDQSAKRVAAADASRDSDSDTSNAEEPVSKSIRKTRKVASSETKRRSPSREAEERDRDQDSASDFSGAPPIPRDAQRARFVGTTPNGEWIFEAPSGTGVVDLPPDGERRARPRKHRRHQVYEAVPDQPPPPTVLPALPPDGD